MARRGYGRVRSTATYEAAWHEAAGPMIAEYTRVGALRRGTLDVVVANSTLLQELGFRKQELMQALTKLLPEEGVKALRFRVGTID
jgi:predicted nucleic acid-binding Zn ribbon protein